MHGTKMKIPEEELNSVRNMPDVITRVRCIWKQSVS